jgi:hypothetical protein
MTPRRSWTLIGADGKPYAGDAPGTLGGHRVGKLYGRVDCRAAALAIGRGGYIAHRVFFARLAKGAGAERENVRSWRWRWIAIH